jgi:hypothetical protein
LFGLLKLGDASAKPGDLVPGRDQFLTVSRWLSCGPFGDSLEPFKFLLVFGLPSGLPLCVAETHRVILTC